MFFVLYIAAPPTVGFAPSIICAEADDVPIAIPSANTANPKKDFILISPKLLEFLMKGLFSLWLAFRQRARNGFKNLREVYGELRYAAAISSRTDSPEDRS